MKSSHYWPKSADQEFLGEFSLKLTSETPSKIHTIRLIEIRKVNDNDDMTMGSKLIIIDFSRVLL